MAIESDKLGKGNVGKMVKPNIINNIIVSQFYTILGTIKEVYNFTVIFKFEDETILI